MLLSGAACTVLTKVMFTSEVIGADGNLEKFTRPWIVNVSMFFGMALVGLMDLRLRWPSSKPRSSARSPSATPSEKAPDSERTWSKQTVDFEEERKSVSNVRKFLLLGLPATCDLTATTLSVSGLVFIPSSVYQMLRGSSIIFAAMFSKALLGKSFNCTKRFGLVIATLGVALVGLAQTLADQVEEGSDMGKQMFGIGLVLVGQFAQALQVVLEELFLKDLCIPVSQVVGIQGLWGLGLMLIIIYPAMYVFPGTDRGHLDDCIETLEMIASSTEVASILIALVLTFGALNVSAMSVTKELSGVHRKMIDAMRTSVIWIFGLAVHYFVDSKSGFSEAWTSFSFLELFGFGLLILGQSIYSELFHFPPARGNGIGAGAQGNEVTFA
eukprot:TRINITY_DN25785_c0_g2_i1.p1 TRINITY_DN25785_c0_g2~~TRINITY_DN25785_c0_g2_i1.p1  ORF type:complete len:422 (-),score=74.17 TRINITY_DN25785_c0_g2_i1:312-1463(-)